MWKKIVVRNIFKTVVKKNTTTFLPLVSVRVSALISFKSLIEILCGNLA